MKRIIGLFMILALFSFSPINTYAEEEKQEEVKTEEKEESKEEKKVNIESVEFVQCDDSKSAKFRNDDNELINVKLLGITVPDKNEDATYEYICNLLKKTDTIKLEYDSNSELADSYGRRYAWVFVDGLLLQDMLVKEGYANISSQVADYKYMDELKSSLNEAKDKEKGIWKVEEEKEEVEETEEKQEKKGFWKKLVASVLGFIDQMLDNILKFLESML